MFVCLFTLSTGTQWSHLTDFENKGTGSSKEWDGSGSKFVNATLGCQKPELHYP